MPHNPAGAKPVGFQDGFNLSRLPLAARSTNPDIISHASRLLLLTLN